MRTTYGAGEYTNHVRSLVELLKERRKEVKLTQEGLAESMSLYGVPMTRAQWAHVESGRKRDIRLAEYLAACRVLELDPSELMHIEVASSTNILDM